MPGRAGGLTRTVICGLVGLVMVFSAAAAALAKREHTVYFNGASHELHVYKITGRKPGKTLMLIGGIQGNEPGGFLSADLYADMSLERGALIVVPRANFHSIVLNKRGPRGDMNRKFNVNFSQDVELKIVEILKNLMAQSDCLLNLHDGSGFYRPEWINKQMNPMRFGQSIIADATVYRDPKTGRLVELAALAEAVCREINENVENPEYRFRFNNHRTLEQDSRHKEQRGSATFYALTKVGIPAFGVETSKSLPTIELKVRHHNLAINAFMKHLGIIPENPGINLPPPKLKYLVVSINRGRPIVVADKDTLTVNRGDELFVSHIEANYERGLTVDFLGLGGISDFRRGFPIEHQTSIVVRKDHQQFGWIRLNVDQTQPVKAVPASKTTTVAQPATVPDEVATKTEDVAQYFVIKINGEERLVAAGQTVKLIEGDALELVDAWTPSGRKGVFEVNFKGWTPSGKYNNGDDRGYVIATDRELMSRWSLEGAGRRYQVVADLQGKACGRFYVQLSKPALDYLIVKTDDKAKYALSPNESLLAGRADKVQLVDVKANFNTMAGLTFHLTNGNSVKRVQPGQWFSLEGRSLLRVMRNDVEIGRFYLIARSASAGPGEIASAR